MILSIVNVLHVVNNIIQYIIVILLVKHYLIGLSETVTNV